MTDRPHHTAATQGPPGETDQFGAVAASLAQRRDEIIAEICAYPPPIPACDAHFNWLLEMRSAVFAEMRELFALQVARASEAALSEFIRASRSLPPEVTERLLCGTAPAGDRSISPAATPASA